MPDAAPRGTINVASLMILPLAGRPCHIPRGHTQHAVRADAVEAISQRFSSVMLVAGFKGKMTVMLSVDRQFVFGESLGTIQAKELP